MGNITPLNIDMDPAGEHADVEFESNPVDINVLIKRRQLDEGTAQLIVEGDSLSVDAVFVILGQALGVTSSQIEEAFERANIENQQDAAESEEV